jgi:hypothetical protein
MGSPAGRPYCRRTARRTLALQTLNSACVCKLNVRVVVQTGGTQYLMVTTVHGEVPAWLQLEVQHGRAPFHLLRLSAPPSLSHSPPSRSPSLNKLHSCYEGSRTTSVPSSLCCTCTNRTCDCERREKPCSTLTRAVPSLAVVHLWSCTYGCALAVLTHSPQPTKVFIYDHPFAAGTDQGLHLRSPLCRRYRPRSSCAGAWPGRGTRCGGCTEDTDTDMDMDRDTHRYTVVLRGVWCALELRLVCSNYGWCARITGGAHRLRLPQLQ